MNVELLLKVKEAILQEPENFGMSWWHGSSSCRLGYCDTAACIAGHACIIAGIGKGTGCDAREVLELDDEQGTRLFHVAHWPEPFGTAYKDAELRDPRICAKAAAKRIDHFIATEGRE